MDISDLLKQGNMGNISPEKLNFLMQFANQNHSGNAKEMDRLQLTGQIF